MATTGTFSWTGANGADWSNASDWIEVNGTAAFADSGTGAQTLLFQLGAGSGPYVVNMGSSVIAVGAVAINSANVTLDVGDSKFQAVANAVSNGAGGTLSMNGGTIELAGGTVQFYQSVLQGGAQITGSGTITNPSFDGSPTLTTSGNNSAIIASGGLLNVTGAGTGGEVLSIAASIDINASGTFEIGRNAEFSSGTINFQGTSGMLSIYDNLNSFADADGGELFNGTLANASVGATGSDATGASVIDFQDNVVTAGSFAGTASAGTIDVVAGGVSYAFDTTGATASYVNWASDGNGGTDVWLDSQPCYVAGTKLLSDRGEVAVEALREGDLIVTLSGHGRVLRPVKWIGTRRLNLRSHPQPNLAAPIRIRQHALGEHLPHRDLLVSPDHCLLIDDRLIPAKLLINHMTIEQELDTAAVEYFHVELDRHAIMLAEGLPAESYLDTGNRAMFSNAGLALTLHPELTVNAGLKRWETDACAPLTVSPGEVRPVWERLAQRAEALGFSRPSYATSDDPDLRLIVDGRVIRPASRDDNHYVFALPAGISVVRLASRAGVPSFFEAHLDEWRNLGVAVRRIVVRDSNGIAELPLDHPDLTHGWYRVERDDATMWRWTNGDAVLPVGPIDGPAMLQVQVGIVGRYLARDEAADRLAA